jgi:hypothetical protein
LTGGRPRKAGRFIRTHAKTEFAYAADEKHVTDITDLSVYILNLTPSHLVCVISCDLKLKGVTAANRVGNSRGPSIMDPCVLSVPFA